MARTIGGVVLALATGGFALSASASSLPGVKTTAANSVPACVTPGRLMAFVKARNPTLEPRFETIAAEYKRHGEQLGLRWDIAFFQMLAETGDLSFAKGGRQAVRADQNNFAGLGAASQSEPGERFPDVSRGVRAHLEHVLVYAGERIDTPVAERTRKVQEWGVLKPWQQKIRGPIGYQDLFFNWANKSKGYGDAIEQTASTFMADDCRRVDPAAAIASATPAAAPATGAKGAEATAEPKPSGKELAQRAIDEARANGPAARFGLGAGGGLAKPSPPITVINEPPAAERATPAEPPARQPAPQQTAAAAGAGRSGGAVAKSVDAQKPLPPGQKCRVWTASYGGDRALIIRSTSGELVNFTVLDVNAGQEAREAEAYIAAYARGGAVAFEFATQASALDKAFELCPEG
jgi:hypothetical protein